MFANKVALGLVIMVQRTLLFGIIVTYPLFNHFTCISLCLQRKLRVIVELTALFHSNQVYLLRSLALVLSMQERSWKNCVHTCEIPILNTDLNKILCG